MNGVVFGVVGIPNVLADDPWVAKPCATASKFSELSLYQQIFKIKLYLEFRHFLISKNFWPN